MNLLKCNCGKIECPAYDSCCNLPTEVHPYKDKVSLLFVGQGGGRDERAKGRPFIGRAGQRLREQIIYAMQSQKEMFGIAFSNTIRDNPEDNRIPNPEEIYCCLEYLFKDIRVLKEKYGLKAVVALGNSVKGTLIGNIDVPISADRGNVHKMDGDMIVIPTFHPSYVMRNNPVFDKNNPSELDKLVIEDILKAYKEKDNR